MGKVELGVKILFVFLLSFNLIHVIFYCIIEMSINKDLLDRDKSININYKYKYLNKYQGVWV